MSAIISSGDGEVVFDTGEVNLDFNAVAGDNLITIRNPIEGAFSRYSLRVSIR